MPNLVRLDDRDMLDAFLRRNASGHLFEIGDLDDRYWPDTLWYGWSSAGELRQVALLYVLPNPPVLLLYGDPPREEARAFAAALVPQLPARVYAHLGDDLVEVMRSRFDVADHGSHLKMHLRALPPDLPAASSPVSELDEADAAALERFYAEAFPGTRVSHDSLSTGRWRAVRKGADLLSVAGLHVYSRARRVAVLGNVATHPGARGQGLATLVSHVLCRALLEDGIEDIGLVAAAENTAAISLYQRLGFVVVEQFRVCSLDTRDEHHRRALRDLPVAQQRPGAVE